MEEPTLQEVFSKVAEHLLAQGDKSADSLGDCKYRDEYDGRITMCAVGCLIPEELYVPEIEGCSIGGVIRFRDGIEAVEDGTVTLSSILEKLKLTRPGILELLKQLQWIHDDVDVDEWDQELRKIAEEYELEYVR